MPHLYHLTLSSRNSKTGPIPVSTSSYSTCPGCMPVEAERVLRRQRAARDPLESCQSEKGRGYSLDELCQKISQLRKDSLAPQPGWRSSGARRLHRYRRAQAAR